VSICSWPNGWIQINTQGDQHRIQKHIEGKLDFLDGQTLCAVLPMDKHVWKAWVNQLTLMLHRTLKFFGCKDLVLSYSIMWLIEHGVPQTSSTPPYFQAVNLEAKLWKQHLNTLKLGLDPKRRPPRWCPTQSMRAYLDLHMLIVWCHFDFMNILILS